MPVKILGITIFPQGMIPRHRVRLAAAIGKAVGEELVSSETIHEQLIGKEFLRRKIQGVVDSYTDELLATEYPSLVEALPAGVREPVLDAIAGLQHRLAEHVEAVLTSEDSRAAIESFVQRRVGEVLGRRLSEFVDEETFERLISFLEQRVHSAIEAKAFETNLRDFVGRRIDELITSPLPLGTMFTDDAIALLKDKANEQIEPTIHQLTELAATERTREQISSLIKHEVHDFYENLSFFKKIFVSRDNLLQEVDELVNESFPRRIEETLRGTFFAEEARGFISRSIDNALAKAAARRPRQDRSHAARPPQGPSHKSDHVSSRDAMRLSTGSHDIFARRLISFARTASTPFCRSCIRMHKKSSQAC